MKYAPQKPIRTSDDDSLISVCDILNKLGQLEDIEEELGIDLATLFKALENGIWSINETIFYELVVCLGKDERGYFLTHRDSDYKCYLKDNGKTWAFTKEELE